jgi:general secretion pathway protein G
MSYDKAPASSPPASITQTLAHPLSGNSGMTMVELIVVAVLISILTLIGLPALTHVKLVAKNARAMRELREIEKSVIAYAIDRGGSYPASLADVGHDGDRDPWGNPYQYSPVLSRTNLFGSLINERPEDPDQPSFDLFSKGADGQSADSIDVPQSDDDIFRAGDGAFIGTKTAYYEP